MRSRPATAPSTRSPGVLIFQVNMKPQFPWNLRKPASLSTQQQGSTGRCIVKGRYTVGKTLSHGSWGKIKEGTDMRRGKRVAIKFIDLERIGGDQAQREIEVHSRIKHPNIVEIFDTLFQPETTKECCLIMEHLEGVDLLEVITNQPGERLNEQKAIQYFRQILEAVSYMHQNGVVHRDLKLENVMITKDDRCKLIDFGFATTWNSSKSLATPCGTLEYAAPEVTNGGTYHGPKADVWSIGVMMYCCLTGHIPWKGDNPSQQYELIRRAYWTPSHHLSPLASDFIDQCLQVDPDCRAGILDLCEHPLIVKSEKFELGAGQQPTRVDRVNKRGSGKLKNFREMWKNIIKA
ncbi:hypothetical protein PROFUN_09837 [Planoprotostelium fungivorum]|uniref:non-specific serine/threonine protein kinase n=1 Tax=Planoprotostelium fungivorum TaxID=1890364 RepID=A0A2P6NFP6_9EUKA|nr:hypothetical protein PROFUN_09837 [Planoprotostelium fungivorum]